jgi:hypothetical protein
MSRFSLLSLLLLALPLCAGCPGATELRLSADKTTISAGGLEAATITAQALVSGSPLKSGSQIIFNTTNGSFSQSSAQQDLTLSVDASGKATLKLWSAASQGTATITGTFTDQETSLTATASISITFGPPSGSQMPVDGKFRITCDAVNIGALRTPVPDVKMTCKLSALTRGGGTITASALTPEFMTEAGSVTPGDDYNTGERVFIYSPKGGDSAPRDVTPDSALNEPSRTDANGKTRNPRDGLCTIIAMIDGEEAFEDKNGNGVYDQDEKFTDTPEPWVDLNDNDQWDSGEPYKDLNGNGKWDAGNGQWDAKTKIMAIYKVLWTGPLDSSSKTSRLDRNGNLAITEGGKLELVAYALDANMNPVAAFPGDGDTLEWTLSSSGDAESNDTSSVALDNALGFNFDVSATVERKRWKILANTFTPKGFHFTVSDGGSTKNSPPNDYTVTAAVHVSPGPSGDGAFLGQLIETLSDKVQGTCE